MNYPPPIARARVRVLWENRPGVTKRLILLPRTRQGYSITVSSWSRKWLRNLPSNCTTHGKLALMGRP